MWHNGAMLRAYLREARDAFRPERASPEEEAALDAHIVESVAFRARTTALVLNAFHLLFWPTDALLLVPEGEAYAAIRWWRLTTFANHAALFIALSLRPLLRRALLVVLVAVAVSASLLGYAMGRMGPLERPFFHMTYLAPMATAALPLRLPQRLLMTSILGAGLTAGFLLARPVERTSAYLATSLGMMIFAVALSLALGHLLFLLERRAFLRGLALQRSQASLRDHNERLTDKVTEQTRELRRLAVHLSQATEEERRRLQRELHDELGQQLVGIRYTVSFMQQRLRKDPAAAEEKLAALGEQVTQLQAGMQHLVAELRPRIIDDRGLAAAARWLVDVTRARSGVACELAASVDEGVRLAPGLAIDAFRILQEALSNALKHGAPGRVRVDLIIAADAVDLGVTDDGCGLRPRAEAPAGFGILGMRERARAHGGELAIEAAPGGGTVVRVRLPVTAVEPA